MVNPMNINEMKTYLALHGVEDGSFYTHGGLGGGEIDGIEQIDGKWFTYFSERGSKNSYKEWASEEAAVEFVMERAEQFARRLGYWKD
jgi:hypothetical protein